MHHGRIVKRTGDGSIIEFRSVVDAVRCAIEVQNAMVERNAGVARGRRIEFRDRHSSWRRCRGGDGDLMGDGVNIAARLEGICEPGGDLSVRGRLRAGAGALDWQFIDLGETQLKNIARADPGLFAAAGRRAAAADRPPARARAKARGGRRRWPALAAAPSRCSRRAGFVWRAGRAARLQGPSVAADKLATAPRLSIVVLPFENLSGDPEQDFFADGITDDLTTDLSHLPDSFVIARNTAFTYKGKPVDAKQIGRELGVRYVLEGSVRRVGENDHGQRPADLDRNRRACLGRPVRRRAQQARRIAGRIRRAPRQFARRRARQGRGFARHARTAEQP